MLIDPIKFNTIVHEVLYVVYELKKIEQLETNSEIQQKLDTLEACLLQVRTHLLETIQNGNNKKGE